MEEIFLPIIGYEGLYEISNLGRVKSFASSNVRKIPFMKIYIGKIGYPIVVLSKNNKSKHKYLHRLLAEHFIANPNNLPVVDHIDNVKTNNDIDNLRWVTKRQNEISTNKKKDTHASKYTGVCFDKYWGRYKATVSENGKTKNLGTYRTEDEAHERYQKYLKEHNIM